MPANVRYVITGRRTSLPTLSEARCWPSLIPRSSGTCHRARSCLDWPAKVSIWLLNRLFIALLAAESQLGHRRSERPAQARTKPRAVCATAPNQLYSWDITYLPSAIRGQFFYLYLFVDIFSRKVVGWQVYEEESSALAGGLLRDLCQRERIRPKQLVLHSDNGSPMKGATMLATLRQLGVTPSLSRPSVSNDNPYSEALFKALKYRPRYPLGPFAQVTDARGWVTCLVGWYNHGHRHSAIRFVTPAQRHEGLDEKLLHNRKVVYEGARSQNPRRWGGTTRCGKKSKLSTLIRTRLTPTITRPQRR